MEKLAQICQVCGHEEDVEECPTCKRYTCQKCFNEMQQKGMLDKICAYCGYIWYSAPIEGQSDEDLVDDVTDEQLITDVVDSIDTELAPVHANPIIRDAQEDSYNRNFREALSEEDNYTQDSDVRFRSGIEMGDRMSDVRFRTEPLVMDRADSIPYDPVSPYVTREMLDFGATAARVHWDTILLMFQGRLRSRKQMVEEVKTLVPDIGRGAIFRWLRELVEEGKALKKHRAMNGHDAFYFLTDQEWEQDQQQFIDPEPQLDEGWAMPSQTLTTTLYDSDSDLKFQAVRFAVLLGAFGAFVLFIFLLGLL